MGETDAREYVSECNDTYVAFGGGPPPGVVVEAIFAIVWRLKLEPRVAEELPDFKVGP